MNERVGQDERDKELVKCRMVTGKRNVANDEAILLRLLACCRSGAGRSQMQLISPISIIICNRLDWMQRSEITEIIAKAISRAICIVLRFKLVLQIDGTQALVI